MPLSPSPTPPASDELQAVQIFQERTSAEISKFFVQKLWTTPILQIARVEPGIWHAMISLSSYHELLFTKPADASSSQSALERHNLGIFALRHHNMAIQAALEIQKTPKHQLSHLISCVVFVTIEMLRGEVIAAMRLLRNGHRVLQEFELQQAQCPFSTSAETLAIAELARSFFDRLTQQAICVSRMTGVSLCQ
ncbi:hypothetical protein E4U41_001086 [Claviceps citrina]|nr:hypothetical protein E4U41_001086 [Claviceps citrina]